MSHHKMAHGCSQSIGQPLPFRRKEQGLIFQIVKTQEGC
jgi:hypothetical protein